MANIWTCITTIRCSSHGLLMGPIRFHGGSGKLARVWWWALPWSQALPWSRGHAWWRVCASPRERGLLYRWAHASRGDGGCRARDMERGWWRVWWKNICIIGIRNGFRVGRTWGYILDLFSNSLFSATTKRSSFNRNNKRGNGKLKKKTYIIKSHMSKMIQFEMFIGWQRQYLTIFQKKKKSFF